MYGPLCWQGSDNDRRGFKKLMWYEIMKEFNCRVSLDVTARRRWLSYTDKSGTMGMEGRRSWIKSSGPRGTNTQRCYDFGYVGPLSNLCFDTGRRRSKFVPQKKKKWAGWRPLDDPAKSEFKKVAIKKKKNQKEGLETTQKILKNLQKSGAHHEVRQRQKK